MTNYLNKTNLLFSMLLLLFSFNLEAQNKKSIFDKMSYTEVLDINITTDLVAIADKRNDKKNKATLSFTDADGISHNWDIKVAVRGKFRRMRCTEIPPLKIHFDKDDLREAGLTKFDDLKLVNQCMSDAEVGKELLLKEYLAYELYNELTPESFRVQFLNITFTDVNTGESVVRSGFFIEDTAQVRDRIGANKPSQKTGFQEEQFNSAQFQTMALFQYWIGNSDWSAIFGRNIKVLEKDGQLIAIPYDFDFSGMVDAPYAVPNTNFGLTSIKQRAYLGFKKNAEELETTIKQLTAMRSTLKKVVKGHELLGRSIRNKTWAYLNSYFNDPREIAFGKKVEIQPSIVGETAATISAEK
ncbi:MAG: hypothetical protein ACI8XB_002622 [Patiriisocius sp.]|jgi:hypothetical protein